MKEIISIDTSFFEEQNFLEGDKLKQLMELSSKNEIKIIISLVTYNEVLSRIKKNLENIKNKLNKEGRILKLSDHKKDLIENFNVENEIKSIKTKFDIFLNKGKVQFIKYPANSIQIIFEKYLNNLPPFSSGQKKYEFPDAFIIMSLEEWCEENNKNCFIISSDQDINKYKSKFLRPITDISQFLDKKIRNFEKKKLEKENLIRLLDIYFIDSADKIKEEIKSDLDEKISSNLIDKLYYGDKIENIAEVNITDLKLHGNSVIYFDNYDLKIEVEFSFKFSASAMAESYEFAIYDEEDERYYNVDYNELNITGEGDGLATLNLEHAGNNKTIFWRLSLEELKRIKINLENE